MMAADRMQLDIRKFLLRQTPLFIDDFVRYPDFSDVVQKPRKIYRLLLFFFQKTLVFLDLLGGIAHQPPDMDEDHNQSVNRRAVPAEFSQVADRDYIRPAQVDDTAAGLRKHRWIEKRFDARILKKDASFNIAVYRQQAIEMVK